jgi:hypothetical protein
LETTLLDLYGLAASPGLSLLRSQSLRACNDFPEDPPIPSLTERRESMRWVRRRGPTEDRLPSRQSPCSSCCAARARRGGPEGTTTEPRPSGRSVGASAASPRVTARSSWPLASWCRPNLQLDILQRVTSVMALRRHRCDLAEISTRVLPWPEWWTPSLAWEDLSAVDRRALIEMLVDKIVIERHPSKIDNDGRRHYLIRAQ